MPGRRLRENLSQQLDELLDLLERYAGKKGLKGKVFVVGAGEDDNKTAAGHAGANLGLVRRVAASLLKQDAEKGSVKASGFGRGGMKAT